MTLPRRYGKLAQMRRELTPGPAAAFHDFGNAVFAEGVLTDKTKHIIAVASRTSRKPCCIRGSHESATSRRRLE